MLDEASEGSVSDDSGTGKASIAGAVLTHRRLLILSATLSVLTAHVPSPAAPATTSFLWLGPALIFCNAAHQVDASRKHSAHRPVVARKDTVDGQNMGMSRASVKLDSRCPVILLINTLSLPYGDRQERLSFGASLPYITRRLQRRWECAGEAIGMDRRGGTRVWPGRRATLCAGRSACRQAACCKRWPKRGLQGRLGLTSPLIDPVLVPLCRNTYASVILGKL